MPGAKCYWQNNDWGGYYYDAGSVTLVALMTRGTPGSAYYRYAGRVVAFLAEEEIDSVTRRMRELRAFWSKPEATQRALLAIWLASDVPQLQSDALTLISALDGIEEVPQHQYPPRFNAPLSVFKDSQPFAHEAGRWTKRYLPLIIALINRSTDFGVAYGAMHTAWKATRGDGGDEDDPLSAAYVDALERAASAGDTSRARSAQAQLRQVRERR